GWTRERSPTLRHATERSQTKPLSLTRGSVSQICDEFAETRAARTGCRDAMPVCTGRSSAKLRRRPSMPAHGHETDDGVATQQQSGQDAPLRRETSAPLQSGIGGTNPPMTAEGHNHPGPAQAG